MKTTGILLAAALAVTAGTAGAGGLRLDGDQFEQQLIEEARRDHARKVGGYNDPITALSNLFAGTLTEKDIAPGINTLHFVPKYQALQGDTVPGEAKPAE